jgi:hypothetical protein
MGGAGTGDERKDGRGTDGGDARRFAVARRFGESARERVADGVADCWTIQPIDAMQRWADIGQLPLALRRVGDRKTRRLPARVVAGQDLIAGASPTIVALLVGRGDSGADIGPPRGRRRIELEGLELDDTAGGAFPLARHAERHGRLSVDVGEDEAAIVEAQPRERRRGRSVRSAQTRTSVENGIALGFVRPPACRFEPLAR